MECNLFAFYKSKLGYNPVDIDIFTSTEFHDLLWASCVKKKMKQIYA